MTPVFRTLLSRKTLNATEQLWGCGMPASMPQRSSASGERAAAVPPCLYSSPLRSSW